MTSRLRRPSKRRDWRKTEGRTQKDVYRELKLGIEIFGKIKNTSLDTPKELDALIELIEPQSTRSDYLNPKAFDLIERAYGGEHVSAVEVLQRLERHEDIGSDPPRRKRDFDYARGLKRRQQAWERRMAGLHGLIYQAAAGNPEPLRDHFEYGGPWQISEEDGQLLAWLFDKLPRTGEAHRPRGSLKPKNLAIQAAAYLVRYGKRHWLAKHVNHKNASNKAANDALFNHAVEVMERDIPEARGKFDVDDVKTFTKKPRKDVSDYVDHELPEAKWEMKQIALRY